MFYWISTTILGGFLIASALSYLFHQATIDGVRKLGFPSYFIKQLAILKFIGALLLIIPNIPIWIKEWAYAGAAFFLLTAMVAHIAHRDSKWILILLIVLMVILWYSRIQWIT